VVLLSGFGVLAVRWGFLATKMKRRNVTSIRRFTLA
jgi:hypothetical protein